MPRSEEAIVGAVVIALLGTLLIGGALIFAAAVKWAWLVLTS